jgi:hypothetical protein
MQGADRERSDMRRWARRRARSDGCHGLGRNLEQAVESLWIMGDQKYSLTEHGDGGRMEMVIVGGVGSDVTVWVLVMGVVGRHIKRMYRTL